MARVLMIAALVVMSLHARGVLFGASTSGSTVVTAEVVSATSLDVSGCGSGDYNVTSFGQLLPGDARTLDGCSVVFGSSNDTSMLRLFQDDGAGAAIWTMDRGLDATWGGATLDGVSDIVDPSGVAFSHVPLSMALLDDGSILAPTSVAAGAYSDTTFVKFAPDGSLDTSFGGGDGIADVVDLGSSGRENWPAGIHPLDDGRILVTSTANPPASTWADFSAVMYNADGTVDTTWANSGIADIVDRGISRVDQPISSHVFPDGSFIMAAVTEQFADGPTDVMAIKYLADGSVDPSYGGGDGMSQIVDVGGVADDDKVSDSHLLVDGSLLIIGNTDRDGTAAEDWDSYILKFDPNGDLDLTYGGGDGISEMVDIALANDTAGRSVLLGDESVVIAAAADNAGDVDAALVKMTPAGALDTTWGGANPDGVSDPLDASGEAASDAARDVALRQDGRLVVAGYAVTGGGTDVDSWVGVFNDDGSIDTSYAGTGASQLFDASGIGQVELLDNLVLGDDGELTALGLVDTDATAGVETDIAAIRVGTTGIADYSGTTDWASVAPNDAQFGACLAAVGGGASVTGGSWTLDTNGTVGDCAADDGDPWTAVDLDGTGPTAKVVESAVAGTSSAQADITFGLRTASSQPPGTYVAPLTFEAVAPNV